MTRNIDIIYLCLGVIKKRSQHVTYSSRIKRNTGNYTNIDSWNVSGITNFDSLFANKTDFNNDISAWNTSSATSMKYMFQGCTSFNQPIGDWNLSLVTDMTSMFSSAVSFNQDISKWNVSNVTRMVGMFINANSFNPSYISTWNVSKVTHVGNMLQEVHWSFVDIRYISFSQIHPQLFEKTGYCPTIPIIIIYMQNSVCFFMCDDMLVHRVISCM